MAKSVRVSTVWVCKFDGTWYPIYLYIIDTLEYTFTSKCSYKIKKDASAAGSIMAAKIAKVWKEILA